MPYRELFTGLGVREGDPPEVVAAFAARDRFARLDPATLWPPPPAPPFACAAIDGLAVSADGRRALVISETTAWLLDTTTMIASPPIELPLRIDGCALDEAGTRAALIGDRRLYRWDLDPEPGTRAALQPVGWATGGAVRLAADGRIAVAFSHDPQATVCVYDLEARALTASLVTNAKDALVLHPGGRHLIAFGDDHLGRVYGRDGLQAMIKRTSGGAISRDGTLLVINDLDSYSAIRLYLLDASGPTLLISERTQIPLTFEVEWYATRARFSPGGHHVLLGDEKTRVGGYRGARLVELATATATPLGIPMTRGLAMLDGDASVLTPSFSDPDLGVTGGVGIVGANGQLHGALSPLADRSGLVGISAGGLYGIVEATPRPIAGELAGPYERPAILSSLLATGRAALSEEDELGLEESFARAAAWQPFLGQLTAGVSRRELVEINRGLVELTPAIVARALTAAAEVPRFGPPQLSLDGLRRAAAEVAEQPDEEFAKMIEWLRASAFRT